MNPTTIPACTTSYIALLGELLKRRGIDTSTWLDGSQLNPTRLEKPTDYVYVEEAIPLIKRAIELTKDPGLGVYFGHLLNLNAHGLLGFAGLVSANVEDSLKMGFQYVETRSPLLSLSLSVEKQQATIVIGFSISLEEEIEQFAIDTMLNSFASMARYLFGAELPPVTIKSKLAEPKHAILYPGFYPAEVEMYFDQDDFQIVFDSSFLNKQFIAADQQALKFAEDRIVLQLENIRNPRSKSHDLSRFIEDWMVTSPGYLPTAELVAKNLNTTSRTLHRKLKKEGTTFSQVIDRIRQQKAKEYLTETDLSIMQISNLLSYNDSSNFARAFKKWTGSSPKEFRKETNK